jgi:glycoside/pentoside/hexuronide:cation symporter, GPH family
MNSHLPPPGSPTLQAREGPAGEGERLPVRTKAAYAIGGTADVFGSYLYNDLANLVFNIYCGLAPSLVGLALGIMRLWDAVTDPLIGHLSDNTRTRWGRRRPYILVGSILSGLMLPLLFLASPDWSQSQLFLFMVGTTVIYMPVISAFNMPYQSLGAELTPDYHERTSVMSWKAVIQKVAFVMLPGAAWFATLPIWNDASTGKPDIALGAMVAAAIAGAWMILAGLANFLFVPERYYMAASHQSKTGIRMALGRVFKCKPYLVLLAVAVVYAVPMGAGGTLGFYTGTYYTFRGDVAASTANAFQAGLAGAIAGISFVPLVVVLARNLGKRPVLALVLGAGVLVQVSSWWLLNPEMPWLRVLLGALTGIAATGFWVLLPSMGADVIDFDELENGDRREGIFTSIRSWLLKLGMSGATILGGVVVEATGFDRCLEVQSQQTILALRVSCAAIPAVALLLALGLIFFFPLSRARMEQIQQQLEARRGRV